MSYYTIKFNTTVQFEILTELDELQIEEVKQKWEVMKELNKPFSKDSDEELYKLLLGNVAPEDIVQILDSPVEIISINECSENNNVEEEEEEENDELDNFITGLISGLDGK